MRALAEGGRETVVEANHRAAPAFEGLFGSGLVDQDVADHFCRESKKLHPVAEVHLPLVGKPNVYLIDQGRGLQGPSPVRAAAELESGRIA